MFRTVTQRCTRLVRAATSPAARASAWRAAVRRSAAAASASAGWSAASVRASRACGESACQGLRLKRVSGPAVKAHVRAPASQKQCARARTQGLGSAACLVLSLATCGARHARSAVSRAHRRGLRCFQDRLRVGPRLQDARQQVERVVLDVGRQRRRARCRAGQLAQRVGHRVRAPGRRRMRSSPARAGR